MNGLAVGNDEFRQVETCTLKQLAAFAWGCAALALPAADSRGGRSCWGTGTKASAIFGWTDAALKGRSSSEFCCCAGGARAPYTAVAESCASAL